MEHLDEVDETARRIGAVNTVTLEDGRLIGSNSDWLGAVRALERETKLRGARAVVLGANRTRLYDLTLNPPALILDVPMAGASAVRITRDGTLAEVRAGTQVFLLDLADAVQLTAGLPADLVRARGNTK